MPTRHCARRTFGKLLNRHWNLPGTSFVGLTERTGFTTVVVVVGGVVVVVVVVLDVVTGAVVVVVDVVDVVVVVAVVALLGWNNTGR